MRSRRPKAFESPFPTSRDEGVLELIEAPEHGQAPLAYWYRFKDGQLRAFTRSVLAIEAPVAHVQSAASTIYNDLQTAFVSKGEEEIVRWNGGANTLVTASVWEDARSGTLTYFVATNEELTLVIFNPRDFQKGEFFLGPERLKDLQMNPPTSGEAETTTRPTPRPLVDLQPPIIREAQGRLSRHEAAGDKSTRKAER